MKLKLLLIAPIIFLILFSSGEYFLLLKHKSPYLSDSYFYKHIFYSFQGDTFKTARNKVVKQIDMKRVDQIEKNFYQNEKTYKYVLGFFTKRPLYPFMAFLLYEIIPNEYLVFLIPPFLSFIGCILFVYFLSHQKFSIFYSIFITCLFISFYPLLDWSTYFLTDIIGAFFWFVQIFSLYKFITTNLNKWLLVFFLSLFVSLFNREQSLLIFIITIGTFVVLKIFSPQKRFHGALKLVFISFSINLIYFLVSFLTHQYTLLETIIYTMNKYGLNHNTYSLQQVVAYQLNAIINAHKFLLIDLSQHHWWFIFFLTGIVGIISFVFSSIYHKHSLKKNEEVLSYIILFSGLASYFAIILYPVLSYRYFIPAVFTVIYFSVFLIHKLVSKYENLEKKFL